MRRRIARQTSEYLARGGVIEQVPRLGFCPKNMQWARDRGMDWMPWESLGGPGLDIVGIDEGCYLVRPASFEGSEKQHG